MAGGLGGPCLEIAQLVPVCIELRPPCVGEAVDLAAFGLLVLHEALFLERSQARIDRAR